MEQDGKIVVRPFDSKQQVVANLGHPDRQSSGKGGSVLLYDLPPAGDKMRTLQVNCYNDGHVLVLLNSYRPPTDPIRHK